MPEPTRTLILAAALAPYLALAAWDGWLHEKARKVPMPEQVLHATLFFAVSAFVYGVFTDRGWLAWPALVVFALAGGIDEFGFHSALEQRERRLHHVAYGCFAGFVAVCVITGALPWPLR